jgi:hypothetical protein
MFSAKLTENQSQHLSIYTNPFDNEIQISTSFENELVPMNIYDSQGRIVMSENIQFTAGKASIKLKNIELGTYILTLIHN